jgi:ABC-type enterochelin transport system substrate-binding protein
MNKLLVVLALLPLACKPAMETANDTAANSTAATSTSSLEILPDVDQRLHQLPKTVIDYDRALLDDNDRQVVAKLIEASKLIDEIYWRQVAEDRVPVWS